jgi:hypothetical protein
MSRVTNADLDRKLDELIARFNVVEAEHKVAKWILRLLGAVFGSIVTWIVTHWKGHAAP